EFDRQEVCRRDVYPAPVSAGQIAAANQHLIAPIIESALIRLTSQEVEVVLPDEELRRVDNVTPDRRIGHGREDRVSLISHERERTLLGTKVIIHERRSYGVEVID